MSSFCISDENEFCRLMDEIDQEMRVAEVPTHARPMRGWFLISARNGLNLRLFPEKREPSPGVYTGDDLTLRIFDWFDERYGDQTKIDIGPGHTVVIIKGDAYRVALPRVYGRVRFIADPVNHGKDVYPSLATSGSAPATANVLDIIVDLQPGFSRTLSPEELGDLTREISSMTVKFQTIENIYKLPLGKEVKGDLVASVDRFFQNPPQYGLSRWDSLQVAEKCMKAYLSSTELPFPKGRGGHNLSKLMQLVSQHSKVRFPQHLVGYVQCNSQEIGRAHV